jgi:hypothetical protein
MLIHVIRLVASQICELNNEHSYEKTYTILDRGLRDPLTSIPEGRSPLGPSLLLSLRLLSPLLAPRLLVCRLVASGLLELLRRAYDYH